MRPKRAFLLAAGLGTRLKPLTDKTPKCLLPLGGKPMLHWWLKTAESLGVGEVLVNTHHLPDQVEDFVRGARYGLKIRLVHEERLLGSAGTLAVNRDFAAGEAFWIFYADTLVAADLSSLPELHARAGVPLTIGLFEPSDPRTCGVVELGADSRIVSFVEKPAKPKARLASAGVFIAGPEVFDKLPAGDIPPEGWDIGKDFIPRFVPGALGVPLDGCVIDIGTLENYKKAQQEWPSLGLKARLEEARP